MSLNFTENVINELSLCMKEKYLAPNETLFKEGQDNTNVFFLTSGSIDITISRQNEQTTIKSITQTGKISPEKLF